MTDTTERLSASLAERYRIERELGAGSMATVYLAHDVEHDRDIAIKVLHPDLGAALGGERFLAEIKTTARPFLERPNRMVGVRREHRPTTPQAHGRARAGGNVGNGAGHSFVRRRRR